MRIFSRNLWVQKQGNTPEEYEDAFWPMRSVCGEMPSFRVAVADGATESSFAGEWARLLVRAWCRGQLTEPRLWREVSRLQGEWMRAVHGPRPLPWYAEEKLRSGAFSSLLGWQLREIEGPTPTATWRALAIGDSCLFQVSGDTVVCACPLSSAVELTARPLLLSTDVGANRTVAATSHFVSGTARPGDSFYLMTDALAHWFLRGLELSERPWRTLDALLSGQPAAQRHWVRRMQSRRHHEGGPGLRNDDVTAVAVYLG